MSARYLVDGDRLLKIVEVISESKKTLTIKCEGLRGAILIRRNRAAGKLYNKRPRTW